jgi:hypothetical protein
MARVLVALLVAAVLALAANFRLYLKDGTYHVVREYQVNGDRVRFYSVERSEWEEIPLSLTDLKRTEAENEAHRESIRKEAAEIAAEDKFEREQREERERIPVETGVYWVDGKELKTIRQAELKMVSNKRRSVLKVLSPVPLIYGKTAVELDGEHSANTVSDPRPEFYMRLAKDERFGIVKTAPMKSSRVVQEWDIVPVSKDFFEKQEDVQIFRKQVDDGLYKIWPTGPLEPGEYAVIEYTEGKGNIQAWDFAYRPQK